MVKISELREGSRKVTISGKIISKGDEREVNTRKGRMRVCDATLEDENSETITLVLWGDEIDEVEVNDTIQVENGFVKEWNGSLQLSAGMYGKISKL